MQISNDNLFPGDLNDDMDSSADESVMDNDSIADETMDVEPDLDEEDLDEEDLEENDLQENNLENIEWEMPKPEGLGSSGPEEKDITG